MSRTVASARYASSVTGFNFEKVMVWGVVVVGGYAVFKTLSAINTVKGALNSVGSAIGSGLYEFFNGDTAGEALFYSVYFPDGSRHAVPSKAVSKNGTFKNLNLSPSYRGDGKTYRIVQSKSDKTRKHAIPV